MWNPYRSLDTDLTGLVAAVSAVLGTLDVAVGDERIREVPNARVLRYYQSNGLIDRPLRYDGRRAMYGFRHLVQAVAVKVLQAEGMSLARVQQALAGRPVEALAGLIVQAAALEEAPAIPSKGAAPSPVEEGALPALRSVWQVEVAPGVTVTIDPSVVSDPQTILVAMSAALSSRGV